MQVFSLAAHLLQIVDELIVEWAVRHELKRTDRVGYTLEEVALSVSEVVHRVSVPLRAGAVVRSVDDAIDDRVAEVHVRVSHVELCTEHHAAFYNLRSVHLVEQLEALFNGTVTIRRSNARSGRCALLLGNLLSSLLVDVGVSVLDHPYGEVPKLLEIVGSVVYVTPFETEPRDVVEDVLNVLVVLFCRVCVVEAQVAHTIVLFSHTEVHADSLGMSDVQIAVRLWREARLYASGVLALCEVLLYELLYETQILLFYCLFFCNCHIFRLFLFLSFVTL